MNVLNKIRSFVMDPPPEFAFEVSEAGIAWARTAEPSAVQWAPLPEGCISVSPLEDNVKEPRMFEAAVRAITPEGNGHKRPAALLLPDFCARVTVLDFDNFPSDAAEQMQLVRFRVKRVVPFDIENAVVACYPQPRAGGGKKTDVVVAVINREVASHFEAPFRAAGFQCGIVTLSALSALSLRGEAGHEQASPSVVAKMSGNVMSLSLLEGTALRMLRCIQLHEASVQEATDVLATTFAYAEDELGARPQVLRLCGIPREADELRRRWSEEFALAVTGMQSRFGAPGAFNAGLYGYLESVEAG